MNTLTYFALLSLIGVVAFWRGGANSGTFLLLLMVAVLAAIPWYFGTRDRTKPPSHVEKVLATIWVWLRRLVGFTVGGALMVGAFSTATSNPDGKSPTDIWIAAVALVAGGIFFFYLGLFGQGDKKSELRDDLRLHSENKRRYRWWF